MPASGRPRWHALAAVLLAAAMAACAADPKLPQAGAAPTARLVSYLSAPTSSTAAAHKAVARHAKTAVIDGVWSIVGSSNLDFRSFVANNEINVVVLGEDFGNVAASRPISPQQWSERPAGDRMLEQLAKLLERWW